MSRLTGSTLVRLIVDVTHDPVLGVGAPPWDYAIDGQDAVMVTEDDSPSVATWDPNVPSGDFMLRSPWSERVQSRSAADGGGIIQWQSQNNRLSTLDTKVRRKINENSRVYLVFKHISAGAFLLSSSYGWRGRALFALP